MPSRNWVRSRATRRGQRRHEIMNRSASDFLETEWDRVGGLRRLQAIENTVARDGVELPMPAFFRARISSFSNLTDCGWLRKYFTSRERRIWVEFLRVNPGSRVVPFYHRLSEVTAVRILGSGEMTEKEATFCLLDQRTLEYVENLAKFTSSGHKIRVSYFLANSWLDRAFHPRRISTFSRRGGDATAGPTFVACHEMNGEMFWSDDSPRPWLLSVRAWPIYERENGGAVMYYLRHGSS